MLEYVFASCRTLLDCHGTAFISRTHGGLTPAAFFRAFVHRKRRYFSGERTPFTAPRVECSNVCSPVTEHGSIVTAQRSYQAPRPADGRRSFWACVCASQKSPFLRQTVVVTAPRAGGVSPPWEKYRSDRRESHESSFGAWRTTTVPWDHCHSRRRKSPICNGVRTCNQERGA
jgi:hypothetical protein